jgi:ribosomal protein S18 acetylase RimI-like enzyme
MLRMTVESGKPSKERAKALARLDKICFKNEAWTMKDWLTYSTENFQTIFIEDDETLVAALAWGWFPVAKTGYLYSFAVHPSYRKQGFGRNLLETFIWQADHGHQLDALFAHTRVSNESSQKLLKSLNFQPNSFVSFYYDDEDAIEWKRQP